MSGPNTISVEKLMRLVGTPNCPLIVDVRIPDDYALDARLIPCTVKLDYKEISQNGFDKSLLPASDTPVVVVCQRGAKLSHGTAALLRLQGIEAATLVGGHEAWREAKLPLVPQHVLSPRQNNGATRWVTRQRPKIDRIACPWLIRRFVDHDAQFLFVASDQVDDVASRFDAIAFDMPEGFWTHRGTGCTFDTMIEEFGLDIEPLQRMAEIIRAADTGRLEDSKQAAGFLAVSLGLSRQFSDDLQQLEAGMVLYDALFRWCRDASDETHNWPANTKVAP
jgi:rhodanese-related sulfurtransferase